MRIHYSLILILGIAGCNVNSQGEQQTIQTEKQMRTKRQTGRQITLDSVHNYLRARAGEKDLLAEELLGRMYLFGVYVSKNYDMAEKHLSAADQGGSVDGAYLLGILYARNDFPRKNLSKSHSLMKRACESGLESACKRKKNSPKKRKLPVREASPSKV